MNLQGLRKYLMVFIIIGIIAAFEAPAKLIPVSYYYYGESSSPLNTSKFGTSTLVTLLRSEGYRVAIVDSQSELEAILENMATNVSRLIYVVISPDQASELSVPQLINGTILGGNEIPISLLIADEPVGGNLNKTSEVDVPILSFWNKCGIPSEDAVLPRSVDAVLSYSNESTSALQALKNGTYVLVEYVSPVDNSSIVFATAYTGVFVSMKKIENNVPVSIRGGVPVELSDVIGYELNASENTRVAAWFTGAIISVQTETMGAGSIAYSYSLECDLSGVNYRLFASIDGTPFTNLALSQGGSYVRYSMDVFRWLKGSSAPNETLVIVDNTVYTHGDPFTGGQEDLGLPQPLTFAIRFHPAFLLLQAMRVFVALDAKLSLMMNQNPLILMGVIATFMLVAFYTLRSSLFKGRTVGEEEVRRRVLPSVIWYTMKPGELKLDREEYRKLIVRLCDLTERYYEKTYGTTLLEDSIVLEPRLLEARLGIGVSELKAFQHNCKRARKPGIADKLFTNWSKRFRDIAVLTEKILEHLGYTLEGRKGKRGIEYG